MSTVAFLGGGKIGEALFAGLLRDGRPPAQILVLEKDAARATSLAEKYGVTVTDLAGVARADVVVVAVKPHDVLPLLAQLPLTPQQLVISVAAGVTTTAMQQALPAGVPVVRSIPNTPVLVGQGITAISGGSHAAEQHLAAAEALLGAVGPVTRVTENQIDYVTAISGSGPAYFFLVVEALIEAGVLLGLTRALATQLVVQTALGSATMLAETGERPAALREAVTSPGGTTIAGVQELESHGLRAAFMAAAQAAAKRSAELGASS